MTVPELELGELAGQEDSQEEPVPQLSLSCVSTPSSCPFRQACAGSYSVRQS